MCSKTAPSIFSVTICFWSLHPKAQSLLQMLKLWNGRSQQSCKHLITVWRESERAIAWFYQIETSFGIYSFICNFYLYACQFLMARNKGNFRLWFQHMYIYPSISFPYAPLNKTSRFLKLIFEKAGRYGHPTQLQLQTSMTPLPSFFHSGSLRIPLQFLYREVDS